MAQYTLEASDLSMSIRSAYSLNQLTNRQDALVMVGTSSVSERPGIMQRSLVAKQGHGKKGRCKSQTQQGTVKSCGVFPSSRQGKCHPWGSISDGGHKHIFSIWACGGG